MVRGSEEMTAALRNTLLSRGQTTSGARCQIDFSLRYEDGTPVKLQERHQHSDRLSILPSLRGRKSARVLSEGSFSIKSGSGDFIGTDFDALTFLGVGQIQAGDDASFALPVRARFSTNITRTGHDNRAMFWRAQISFTTPCGEVVGARADSPGFVYLTRTPKGPGPVVEHPFVQAVICDARPGDLLVLQGDRLAHPKLVCHIQTGLGDPIELRREPATGWSTFTARLPVDIAAGPAIVQVLTNDGHVSSNRVQFSIRGRYDVPALPCTPLPLALTQGSGSSQPKPLKRPREEITPVQAIRQMDNPPKAPRKESSPHDPSIFQQTSRLTLTRQGSDALMMGNESLVMMESPPHILPSPSHDFLAMGISRQCSPACGARSLSRTISEEFAAFLNKTPVSIPLGVLASPVQTV